MNLNLSDEQRMLVDNFSRLIRGLSSPAHVRASQPLGFDSALWRQLAESGAIAMRANGLSLHDAALVLEEAGRGLAATPLIEAMVATTLLGSCGLTDLVRDASEGRIIPTVALQEVVSGQKQVVPAGAVADIILYLQGDSLFVLRPAKRLAHVENLACMPLAEADLVAVKGQLDIIAQGPLAHRLFAIAHEEWKLLMAAALVGLSQQALELAAAYAAERKAFGQPIGSFQGLSHPMADRITELEGARLLVWRTIQAIADNDMRAGALVSMTFWWAASMSTKAVALALHCFGGYGLTVEYDIHLFHVRARAWSLMTGDPEMDAVSAGRRLWLGEKAALPAAGDVSLDFSFGPDADVLAEEVRQFFRKNLTPELRAKAHYSYSGHDAKFHRALGEARLLYPNWPVEHGGRGCDVYGAATAISVFHEFGWTIHAQSTTAMVGEVILRFGTAELKAEVMGRISGGESICSLGYTEPHCGSDVFATRTTAVREGDAWVINGQKMFTSGADQADYVLLLTRTDLNAPKHKGLTVFLVPLKTPGIEIRPIYTFQEEHTNATFYSDVRLPDRYRLGPVNGGVKVLAMALELEQGGGNFIHEEMLQVALDWAKTTTRGGQPAIHDPVTLSRLARTATHLEIGHLLHRRSLWLTANRVFDKPHGPISKLFTTETFITDSADLVAMVGPQGVLRDGRALSALQLCYRHATATSIYGGTSEVMRSMIAEKALGLPRSRV
jgi:alkylation response protein AidB-like acyl-CoA dehydrogenase